MPFTFSHPAIVLPFKWVDPKWFSITGLVIGSMIPDFEYFLRMKIQSDYSHTLGGVFWFDLPLCIVVAFVFHTIVRNSLIDNLPKFLKIRFIEYKSFNWNNYFRKNWIIVIISALAGIFSHFLWDAFTHWDGFFVQNSTLLNNTVSIGGYPFPVFKLLQHASSLIGEMILVVLVMILHRKEITKRKINISYWFLFLAIAMIIVFIRIFAGLDYRLYGTLIVTIISAALLSLIILGVVWKWKANFTK